MNRPPTPAQRTQPGPGERSSPASAAAPVPGSPQAAPARWVTGVEHYENFPVASVLVPRSLRPAVIAIYRFARYADDVADEGDAPPDERLAELERLRAALEGRARHPVVDALGAHVASHSLTVGEFVALLSAFAQDVTVKRYADFAALRDYCARSADPIGHLILELFGARNARSETLADSICSALQLINFLQDLAIDWRNGRLYLPMDELAAAGIELALIDESVARGRAPAPLREFLAAQARRCAALLESGAPLTALVPGRLAWELRAILAGGRRTLEQLAARGYDPIASRPSLGWRDAPALLRLMFVKSSLQ